MITGASTVAAASMIASPCSMLLMLNGRHTVAVLGGVIEQLSQRDPCIGFSGQFSVVVAILVREMQSMPALPLPPR